MIELWQQIAAKLHLTEEEALLLHAFNRGWVNTLARRKCYLIVNRLVEEFALDDRDFTYSYAGQLYMRGVLTATEAQLFAGGQHGTQSTPTDGMGVTGTVGTGGAGTGGDNTGTAADS